MCRASLSHWDSANKGGLLIKYLLVVLTLYSTGDFYENSGVYSEADESEGVYFSYIDDRCYTHSYQEYIECVRTDDNYDDDDYELQTDE